MQITRENIIQKLQEKGYNVEAHDVLKNGVICSGIIFHNHTNVAPVIYTDSLLEQAERQNETLEDVVEEVINTYISSQDVTFDTNIIHDKDTFLNNLYIALQKDSEEDIVKRPSGLEGIESYLYLRMKEDDTKYTTKVSNNLLDSANVTEEEAWTCAEENTNAETIIESLAKKMAKLMGMEYSEAMEGETPFFVLSNQSEVKGASAILNKKVLAEFGKKHHVEKIVVLPSSIHEVLILPYEEDIELHEFSTMVREVNATQVNPTERLTDKAYVLEI